MSPGDDERRYVRAVEGAWSRLQGRQAVVSPREFEAVSAWCRRGIPLSVVLEVISDAGKRRTGRVPRSLTSLASAVSEAWEAVASGRATPQVVDARPARSEAIRAWEAALARCPDADPLRPVLTGLLAGDAEGAPPDELDATLDAALASVVSREVLESATRETTRALESFRERMSAEEFRKTFARALADALRRMLSLPRLTLTR